MRYIKGLLRKKLKNWTNKKWYHQRFDGSPYFLQFIAEAEISIHDERKLGCDFSVHYCFFKDGRADWYILRDDIKKVSEAVMDTARKNPDISAYFIKLWQPDQELFYRKCAEIEKINFGELSNEELITLHDEFVEITLNRNSSSSIIDGFALGTDELLAEKIKKAYESTKLEMKFEEVFSILTAPLHSSFITEAELGLLELAAQIGERGLKNVFLDGDVQGIKVKLKDNGMLALLEDHQRKFFWLMNNYISNYVLDVDYFIAELKRLFEINVNIKEEIEKIKITPELNRKKKGGLFERLKLNNELKTLIKISEDFTYWQDERKKATLWTTHYLGLILKEIGNRAGISLDDLKYATWEEVSIIFKEKLDSNELRARKKNCVYYCDKEGIEILHSAEVEEVEELVLGKKDLSDIDDFRGLTASLGKAVGKARIIRSATEIGRVEKGDILVAVMTRTDYVPAMKKAAAIVTDEGGVTCHAAIISRELGIPCIIGTKIATKVLKEGQLVEVNANHGWVKIIK